MEKERRKNYTKNAMRLWDATASKSLVLERIEEISKTGLRHEHALLLYAKKREWTKNSQSCHVYSQCYETIWGSMDTHGHQLYAEP